MKLVLVPHDQFVLYQEKFRKNKNDNTLQPKPSEKQCASLPSSEATTPLRLCESSVVSMLPKPIRNKSLQLLPLLEKSQISWNNDGELNIAGKVIPNSHICDILHFMQYKSKSRPVGIRDALKHLHNCPRHLIGNPDIVTRNHVQTGGALSPPPPGIPNKNGKQERSLLKSTK